MSAHATAHRSIPLAARRDLVTVRLEGESGATWVVKDPVSLQYFELSDRQHHLLKLLDGQRSLDEVQDGYQREFRSERPTPVELRTTIDDLHSKGLLLGCRPGQAEPLLDRFRTARRRKFWQAIQNALFIVLPGWDPEPLLGRLYPFVRFAFRPVTLLAAAAFVVMSWVLLLVRFDEVQQALPTFHQFFGWENMALLWLTLGAAKMAHELGHGLACRHFGGECHSIGVAFLVFSPCLYCDVSDAWMVREKWKRVAVSAAGVAVEVFLSAIALWIWFFTRPGLVHYLALNVFLVTTLTTVLFNANPLLQYDGYYILSDWLEIPNLRGRADRFLAETFARVCLGKSLPSEPRPMRSVAGFVLYALASAANRWFLAGSMFLVLYDLLKPYGLQNLGLIVAGGSVVFALARLLSNFVQMIRMPTDPPARPTRVLATIVVASGTIAAAALWPIPWHVDAPLLVEAEQARHVYTSTAGQLQAVNVAPGQRVRAGDVLATFQSFPRQDQLQQLILQRDTQRQEVALHKSLDRVRELEAARKALDAIESQIAELNEQTARLTLVAPCDGVVIAPPLRDANASDPRGETLGTWDGEPLGARNVGCWYEPRVHLLSVAPRIRYEAIAWIDQQDRTDVASDLSVALKFEGIPDRSYGSHVGPIADAQSDSVPPALSNKYGGPLPTTTDGKGEERPARSTWRTTIAIPDDADLSSTLRPGMRGIARIEVRPRTAVEWLWTAFQATVHFRK